MSIFIGSGVAIITPFNKDQTVNYNKLKELIEFQISKKTDALVVTGTTGEASTLSDQEQKKIIEISVNTVAKRIPVIAGTGSNSTAHAIKLSKQAEEVGADGILLITPYYNKTNKKGLLEHFKAVANSVNIPVILYNVPGRTGMNIPLEVYKELENVHNIIGVKEASGDMTYLMNIKRLCGERFDIYSGNDDIILPVVAAGGKGVISVLANICPNETHDIVHETIYGSLDEARKIQYKFNSFIHSLFVETNPIPIKAAMNLMGMNVGGYRAPLYELSHDSLITLKNEMKKLNLIQEVLWK